MSKIHATAIIDPKAKLGKDVEVGPFTIVHPNVVIGDRTKIGSHCEIGVPTSLGDGSPLSIGVDSHIRSHSIFYESSAFGPHLVTGHKAMVRENTKAGEYFQIGTQTEIQGDCKIGDHVRTQSNVFISKYTEIGSFVWLFPYVVLTNDPTPPSNELEGCIIHDYAAVGAASVVLPGITIGEHALIAAQACVTKDVPPGMAAAGVPAKIIGETKSIMKRDGSGRPAYPWTREFHRGYPEEMVKKWKAAK